MRYTPGNKYLIYNTIKNLGGKATSFEVLNKIQNLGYTLNFSSLSQYFTRLKNEGVLKSEGMRGSRYQIYSIIENDFEDVEPKTYVEVVYLSFRMKHTFNEISILLNVPEELVRKIYTFECEVIYDIKTKFILETKY